MNFIDFLPQAQPNLFLQSQAQVPQFPYGNAMPGQIQGMGAIPRIPTPMSSIQGMGAIPAIPRQIQGMGAIPQLPRMFAESSPIPQLPGIQSTAPVRGMGSIPRLPSMSIVDDVVAGSTAAKAVPAGIDLGKYTLAEDAIPMAAKASRLGKYAKYKGVGIGAGLFLAQNALNPQFQAMQEQGGNKALIGGAAKGALSGAALGAGVGSFVPGVGTALGAGAGGIIGGALGALGTGTKADKVDTNAIVEQLGASGAFSMEETSTLKLLMKTMEDGGTPKEQIVQQILLPIVQQRMQEQQQQSLAEQQREQYVLQVQDYFNAQQKAIDQSTMLGSTLAAPWIDRMRQDADMRQTLVDDALSNSSYPSAYREILSQSQGRVGQTQRALADSYAQQLRTAPYYALQQQQAQVLEQLRQQSAMAPPQSPLTGQLQQQAATVALGTGQQDILSQLLASGG